LLDKKLGKKRKNIKFVIRESLRIRIPAIIVMRDMKLRIVQSKLTTLSLNNSLTILRK
jgi:hypothetical protein